jgi:hypothetical protein
MPPEIVDKIMNNISVTQGKEDGHGLGLMQVREALQKNRAKLSINSKIGIGTSIILTFPRVSAPNWITEKINLKKNDIVIILDDDHSIHTAWDKRFESVKENTPTIEIKHFTFGIDAMSFINDLPLNEKSRVFLLTDYELLKQNLDGLKVIEETKVERSILVTSHYSHKYLQDAASIVGVKVLPKQLSSEVLIVIE